MPHGRRPNYDQRIADLIGQLKAAIVARERVEMEARVAVQLGALANRLVEIRTEGGHDGFGIKKPKAPAAVQAKAGKSSAGRLRQIAAMKAYWRKKKAAKKGEGKGG